MLKYEKLFTKICDNFHEEINPVLAAIDNNVRNEYHFQHKGYDLKLRLIKSLISSIKNGETENQLLVQLKEVLRKYEIRFKEYFKCYPIAAGYVFYPSEDILKFQEELGKFDEYLVCQESKFMPSKFIFISINLQEKPDNCARRYLCWNEGNGLKIKQENYPDKIKEKQLVMRDYTLKTG